MVGARSDAKLRARASAIPSSPRSAAPAVLTGRHLLFAPIAAAHIAAFVAFHAGSPGVATEVPLGITVFDVAQAAPLPRQADVSFELEPVAVEDIEAPTIDVVPDLASAPSDAAATGVACDLTAAVQATLRSDASVRAALASLPRADRSVANAVMLWDGRWIDGASPQSSAALAQIRGAVQAAVGAAPAACRAEAQTGPRLFAVAGPPDTMLALGSGRWRWGDLASP